MTLVTSGLRSGALIVIFLASLAAAACGEHTAWEPQAAGKYLDEREEVWFA